MYTHECRMLDGVRRILEAQLHVHPPQITAAETSFLKENAVAVVKLAAAITPDNIVIGNRVYTQAELDAVLLRLSDVAGI